MRTHNSPRPVERKLVTSKSVVTITSVVVGLTILNVWLFGLGQHRTLFENSLRSTGILSLAFFLFLTLGLYKGIKLKDNMGQLTDKLKPSKIPNLSELGSGSDWIQLGDGIEGILFSLLSWLVVTVLVALFFWLFGAIVWTGIIVFLAILYWIFFRALRLVFKNSNQCRGRLTTSMTYGLAYTMLYISWIYGIILLTHYL